MVSGALVGCKLCLLLGWLLITHCVNLLKTSYRQRRKLANKKKFHRGQKFSILQRVDSRGLMDAETSNLILFDNHYIFSCLDCIIIQKYYLKHRRQQTVQDRFLIVLSCRRLQQFQACQIIIMFLCCCPKKRDRHQQLQQSLIEGDDNDQKNDKNKQLDLQNSQVEISPYDETSTRTEQRSDDRIRQMGSKSQRQQIGYQSPTANRTRESARKDSGNLIGIAPSFQNYELTRRNTPGKQLLSYRKSHLWMEQLKSDLIYFNLKSTNYIYLSFRITKNQQVKSCSNALDYILSKSPDRIHVVVGRQPMITGKLATLNKYSHNAIIANYGTYSHEEEALPELIIMEDLRAIRWAGVDDLVVLTDGLLLFEEIKLYFNTVLNDLTWEELRKAIFVFPVFMNIEQISVLLFGCMRQFVINNTLQKASLDLAFDMELIESSNRDSFIIVKSRREQSKAINSVYDHLKTSFALFGKRFCDETQKICRDFYVRVREKSLKDYFGLKEIYRRNPAQFRAKIRELRDLDPIQFTDLQNVQSIREHECEEGGFYYVIENKVREDIGRIFNIAELQKKEVNTPVKSEWDDDVTADDFKSMKLNKLDAIAKQQLDKIDLDMGLADSDQEDEHQYYKKKMNLVEHQLIMNVQQSSPETRLKKSEKKTPVYESKSNKFDRRHRHDDVYQ